MEERSALAAQKAALRGAMIALRDGLDAVQRGRRSRVAADRLVALPELARAGTVSGFVAIRSEIDPARALDAARALGACTVLPRIGSGSPRLRFHRADSSTKLVAGRYGLLEPEATAPEVPAEAIDILIAPGLAFDPAGARLGYGQGYFDEVGARVREAGRGILVGLAFDCQLVHRVPSGPTDVLVDLVVTDLRTIRVARESTVT